MLFGYIQLRQIKPLQNPLIVQLKEQFDGDTQNKELQDQIRSLDLIARRAYFTATWQVRQVLTFFWEGQWYSYYHSDCSRQMIRQSFVPRRPHRREIDSGNQTQMASGSRSRDLRRRIGGIVRHA
ncbi:MAG: hypothetical protein MZV63_62785 [Marinilabiliales bacterium]|nr:hypothetical protein [Marinilabiliales bacterium]